LGDLFAAKSTIQDAVVQGTNAKQARAWSRFNSYLILIGCYNDPYLESFSRAQRHRILVAFAHAIREGRFSSEHHKTLKSESIRATLDCVAQTFKLADKPDPRLDGENKLAFILQRQLRYYSNSDTPTIPQAAMIGSILREFYKLSNSSSSDKALCELFIGAFFFAMRSCEYIKVTGYHKTKLLQVKNIRFFRGKRCLDHKDSLLHMADCVSITFELQKKDTKHDTITQHRSGNRILCPVRVWASIIKRIISYQTTTKETAVNTYLLDNNSIHLFTGKELLHRLRLATSSIGSDTLGFTADQIGLHSARSGAAMAMYLAGVPIFTIMLIGRWSSDAFMRYIRKQVKEFSEGISSKMIHHEQFFTIPSEKPSDLSCSNHTKFGL